MHIMSKSVWVACFSFSHCIYSKIWLMRNRRTFSKNGRKFSINGVESDIVSGSSSTHHRIFQQTSPSCLIFSCSISWVVWVWTFCSTLYEYFSSPPTGPCILVLLYNYPKTMVIQHHPAILLQGAIRNLTSSIQITWDGHSWSRSVAFTCNA